jgi:hypothetical protein
MYTYSKYSPVGNTLTKTYAKYNSINFRSQAFLKIFLVRTVFIVPIKHLVISIRTHSSNPHTLNRSQNFNHRTLIHCALCPSFLRLPGTPATNHTLCLPAEPFRAFRALRYLAKAKKTRQQEFYYIRGSFASSSIPFRDASCLSDPSIPFQFRSLNH